MVGLIPIGSIEAAADLTTAELVRLATRTQREIDARIGPVVADVIADNPDVVAAAVDAVEDVMADLRLPAVTPTGTGVRFQDEDGNDLWMGAGPDGALDYIAKWAIVNALHWYVGPDAPYVWPGNFVVWVQTDASGEPVQTLIGRN